MISPDFLKRLNRLSKLYTRFPDMAAIEAVNFSKERFVRKNWLDKSPKAWKQHNHHLNGILKDKRKPLQEVR